MTLIENLVAGVLKPISKIYYYIEILFSLTSVNGGRAYFNFRRRSE